MADPLISAADLRESVRSSGYSPAADADYERAVLTGTEWVEDRCSDPGRGLIRQFRRDTNPVGRLFHPSNPREVVVGDFDTDGGNTVLVEVDETGTGVWVALPSTAWHPEDTVRARGFPFTRIVFNDYTGGFPLHLAPSVRVTTRWGFAAVPSRVVDAARLVAIESLIGTAIAAGDENNTLSEMTGPFAVAERLLAGFIQADLVDATPMGQPPGSRMVRAR